MLYNMDGQLKVAKSPVNRTLKSSEPEYRRKK